MKAKMDDSAKEFFDKGEYLFRKGEGLAALASFEKSAGLDASDPICKSYIALLSATERGELNRAIKTSEELASTYPRQPLVCLNLGRLYLRAGRKAEAVEIVRKGLALEPMPEAVELLESLGLRKKPVIPFLPRRHFLNKYAGLIFKKLGLR
ncbi:MAG: tetratricopeptide repeat protein [Nitrospiraceae bacterium]|nr:tetratricopeptide repeat protein [Nitrospiraceae bacterium]